MSYRYVFLMAILMLALLTGCSATDIPERSPAVAPSPDITLQPTISFVISPSPTPSQSTGSVDLINEYNTGAIYLGMTSDELIEVPYEIADEFYCDFSEEGKLWHVTTNGIPTKDGLRPGDTMARMTEIYGETYFDTGAGPGEDTFLYYMGDYSLFIHFFDHNAEVVTGWGISCRPDYLWDFVANYLEPHLPEDGQIKRESTAQPRRPSSRVEIISKEGYDEEIPTTLYISKDGFSFYYYAECYAVSEKEGVAKVHSIGLPDEEVNVLTIEHIIDQPINIAAEALFNDAAKTYDIAEWDEYVRGTPLEDGSVIDKKFRAYNTGRGVDGPYYSCYFLDDGEGGVYIFNMIIGSHEAMEGTGVMYICTIRTFTK